MYAKLVLRNARRSIQDYLVYLLTMTICVTLFYSFLSISSSYYEPDIGTEYDFTMLSDGMKLAICAVTLILLFLIRFVNHYMLRRKQREFASSPSWGWSSGPSADSSSRKPSSWGWCPSPPGSFWGVLLPVYHGAAAHLLWEAV